MIVLGGGFRFSSFILPPPISPDLILAILKKSDFPILLYSRVVQYSCGYIHSRIHVTS